MKVFFVGEGRHDLGRFHSGQHSRATSDEIGVLEAFLLRLKSTHWSSGGGVQARNLRAFQLGRQLKPLAAKVAAAALQAREAGCSALVFVIDLDDPKYSHRVVDVEAGRGFVGSTDASLGMAVAVAVLSVDGWVLAALGDEGTEILPSEAGKAALEARSCGTTAQRSKAVLGADLAQLPNDAKSLRGWLSQVTVALQPAA